MCPGEEEVQNTIFEQHQAASCTIGLDDRPSAELLEHLRTRIADVLFVGSFDL